MNCKSELKNFIENYGWSEFEEALEEIKEDLQLEKEKNCKHEYIYYKDLSGYSYQVCCKCWLSK